MLEKNILMNVLDEEKDMVRSMFDEEMHCVRLVKRKLIQIKVESARQDCL